SWWLRLHQRALAGSGVDGEDERPRGDEGIETVDALGVAGFQELPRREGGERASARLPVEPRRRRVDEEEQRLPKREIGRAARKQDRAEVRDGRAHRLAGDGRKRPDDLLGVEEVVPDALGVV